MIVFHDDAFERDYEEGNHQTISIRLPGTEEVGSYSGKQIWDVIKKDVAEGKYHTILVGGCGSGIKDRNGVSFLSALSRAAGSEIYIKGTDALVGGYGTHELFPADALWTKGELKAVRIPGAQFDIYQDGKQIFDGLDRLPYIGEGR